MEFDLLKGLESMESLVIPAKVRMTKDSIDMHPSHIDWFKEDILLKTPAGVLHTPNGKKYSGVTDAQVKEILATFSPRAKVVCTGNGTYHAFELVDCGEYLSFNNYYLINTYSVEDYKKAIAAKETFLRDANPFSYYYRSDEEVCVPDTQIRFYKDRSIVVLFRFDLDDGESVYAALRPEYVRLCKKDYDLRINFNCFKRAMSAKEIIDAFDICSKKFTEDAESPEPALFHITDERELENYKFKVSHTRDFLRSPLADQFMVDMSRREFCRVYGGAKTVDENILNRFFGFNEPENADVKSEFLRKYKSGYGTSMKNIRTIEDMNNWLRSSGASVKSIATRENNISEMWETLHWSSEDHGTIWERRGDLVIVTFVKTDSSSGYRYSPKKCAFIYNSKTKKRWVITQQESGSELKSPIPSLKHGIIANFELGVYEKLVKDPKATSRWSDNKYVWIKTPDPIFWDGVSLKDLFHNTNVEWILENTVAFDDSFECITNTICHYGSYGQIVKLKDEICETKIGNLAAAILATSGDPTLEQLLKNKLFNLYFKLLMERVNGCDHSDDIYEIKEAGKTDYGIRGYQLERKAIVFNSKEKSLKKMFWMTPEQLRLYDSKIEIVRKDTAVKEGLNGDGIYLMPMITGAKGALGIEGYNMLDVPTFTKILDLSIVRESDSWNRKSPWARMDEYMLVKQLMEHMNVKQKIEFISKYNGKLESYNDYLKMRNQMAAIQAAHPADSIYSPKWYPDKPGNCHRFVYYRSGMTTRGRWSRDTINSTEDFKRYIASAYGSNGVTIVKDEHDNVTGASIEMDSCQHMEYLHEELSVWFSLYKDEHQMASFKAAVKRVLPYEWTDEETGLSIIAPATPNEVQKEGKDNSFCVGSFVGPICDGTTNVMFVRRTDMIADAYYCVELVRTGKDGKFQIRQCHTYANHDLSYAEQDAAGKDSGHEVFNKHFDVGTFLVKWAKHFKDDVDAASIKDTYGRLCAYRG